MSQNRILAGRRAHYVDDLVLDDNGDLVAQAEATGGSWVGEVIEFVDPPFGKEQVLFSNERYLVDPTDGEWFGLAPAVEAPVTVLALTMDGVPMKIVGVFRLEKADEA